MFLINLIFISLLAFVVSMKNCKCPTIPKHYEELNCTPIIRSGDCCPHSYNCSNFENRDKDKCYFKDKTFDVDEELGESDLGRACIAACYCDSSATFNCAEIDCPEFFRPPPGKNCIRQYNFDNCCSIRTVCDENLKSLSKCEVNNKTYYEGQLIDTKGSCYTCICGKDYENVPFHKNKHCKKISCAHSYYLSDQMLNGCVPVYWKKDNCCPIGFRCPDDSTVIIPGKIQSEFKCKFGNLRMSFGDSLSPENVNNNCTICTCKTPPYPTCIRNC